MGSSMFSVSVRSGRGGTRERILDAAAALFYEHGFHATGLDRVLAEVGLTKTTFYNHFESKDALIVALLHDRDERDMASLIAELESRGGGVRERVLRVFDVLDTWFHDDDFRGCLFINAANEFPGVHDPVHKAAMRHERNLAELFEGLARRGDAADPPGLARQLCMLVRAAITSRHTGGDMGAARMARDIASALLDRELRAAEPPSAATS